MKHLLSTTALVMMVSLPLHAQETGAATDTEVGQTELQVESMGQRYTTDQDGMRIHADDLIGYPVYVRGDGLETTEIMPEYAEAPDEWDRVGEIGDVVVGPEGAIKSVVLDIGGFLGLGEKHVNTSMEKLKFARDSDDDGEFFIVYTGDQTRLEQEREFDKAAIEEEGDSPYSDLSAAEREAGASMTAMERGASEAVGTTTTILDEAGAETAEMVDDVKRETADIVDKAEEETALALANAESAAENAGREVEQTLEGVDPDPELPVADRNALTAEDLDGAPVYDAKGKEIGEVSEIILSQTGEIDRVVIDVGGFLGLGEKPVAVPFDALRMETGIGGVDPRVSVDYSESELKDMEAWKG